MGTITATQVISLTDKIAAWRLSALGNSTSGVGLGTAGGSFGAWKRGSECEAILTETQDLDTITALASGIRGLKNASGIGVFLAAAGTSTLNALNITCGIHGVSNGLDSVVDLNTFATHYNLTATTKWQCLFSPEFLDVYIAALGSSPSAHNTYYEVLQSGSGTALGKLIVGTGFLSPGTIDSTKYAGGFGQVIATSLTGSGVVTVTGTWRKTDGSTATGDGTATVTTVGSAVALAPPFTSALLLAVSGISAAGGIGAGTLYAEAARPSGRSNPPT